MICPGLNCSVSSFGGTSSVVVGNAGSTLINVPSLGRTAINVGSGRSTSKKNVWSAPSLIASPPIVGHCCHGGAADVKAVTFHRQTILIRQQLLTELKGDKVLIRQRINAKARQ